MKRRLFPAISLALAGAMIYVLFCLPLSTSKGSLDLMTGPFEHFWQMRAYPEESIDPMVYQQAIRAAMNQDHQTAGQRSPGVQAAWRMEGPVNITGRINTLAIHPTDQHIMFAGASSGGIYRTTDGGQTWESVFDESGQLAIGHLVFDPQDPQVIYAGTGDRNVPSFTLFGNGIWKSTDGGDTWQHLGLDEQRIITKIAVHPLDSRIIYAASMGLISVRDEHRGLYKTTDGGSHWEQVLFLSDTAGIIDLVMDPYDHDILYAAGWNRLRTDFQSVITGEDAGIYKTTDGGEHWQVLTDGLPEGPMGRIGLTISPVNPNKLYALYVDINSNLEGIYVTTDAGAHWSGAPGVALPGYVLGGFGWYFGRIEVNPKDDDDLWVCGVDLWHSPNGGIDWELGAPEWWKDNVHADKHDLVFRGQDTIFLATDGGVYKTVDGGNEWGQISEFPSIQFYRIAVNPHVPGEYWGGAQDNGTLRGNHLAPGGWTQMFGGDGFQPIFHPSIPEIIYVQTQNGGIYVSTDGGTYFDIADDGIDDHDRRNWDMPMIGSQHFADRMYTGTFRVYQNSCGNDPSPCWIPNSPDLTDGIEFGERYHTISALAESPIDHNLLFAGTSDGNIWYTANGGGAWQKVSDGLPDRYVTSLVSSREEVNRLWVTHSGYRANDFTPHIYQSDDLGVHWSPVDGNLPPVAINKLWVSPEDELIMFVATDAGVYVTSDGGFQWQRLGQGMPYVPVFDLAYDAAGNRLVAGTFGRSMMSFPIDSIELPTGVQRVAGRQSAPLTISPIPAHTEVTLGRASVFPGTSAGVLRVFSSTGELVHQQQVPAGTQQIDLSVGMLPGGMYTCAWQSGDEYAVGRLLVVRP